jgi:predicted dehydrogenase
MDGIVSIAVAGAGLIGKRHVEAIAAAGEAVRLHAIVDPADTAAAYAADCGVPWYPSLSALLATDRPDGVILGTPNQVHVENGLECVAAGIPTLVEKPIAGDAASARRLVEAATRAGVPLAVGHHRRHNPLVAAAKAEIEGGALGRIVAVHGMFWLFKPDDYFDVAWRRQPGAGPLAVNLISTTSTCCGTCAARSSRFRRGPRTACAAIRSRKRPPSCSFSRTVRSARSTSPTRSSHPGAGSSRPMRTPPIPRPTRPAT